MSSTKQSPDHAGPEMSLMAGGMLSHMAGAMHAKPCMQVSPLSSAVALPDRRPCSALSCSPAVRFYLLALSGWLPALAGQPLLELLEPQFLLF